MKFIASVLVAVGVGSAFAGAYAPVQTEWQAVGGSYDGEFTDANHWKDGYPEDYAYQAYLPYVAKKSYAVAFPQGAFTNTAAFRGAATDGTKLTLSGAACDWTIPGGETDIHPAEPWALYWQVYPLMSLNVTQYAKPVISFKDFDIEHSIVSKYALLDFKKGSFDFGDPEGGSYSTLPSVKMNFKDNPKLTTFELRFGEGTSSRLPSVGLNLNSAETVMRYLGGAHAIKGSLTVQTSGHGDVSAATAGSYLLSAEGGANVTVDGTVTLAGNNGQNKKFAFAADGGTLTFNGEIAQPGSNAGVSIRATEEGRLAFANTVRLGANGPATIALTNATLVRTAGAWQFGPTQTAAASTTPFRFTAKKCLIDQSVKANVDLRGDTLVEFTDCVWTNKGDKSLGALATPGFTTRLVLKGGSSYNTEDFKIATAGPAVFTVDGGSHVINSAVFQVPAGATTGEVEVNDGVLRFENATAAAFGYRAGGTGVLRLNGGVYATKVDMTKPATDGSTSRLEANGGTWSNMNSSATLSVAAFTEATIGPGGFTIDTNGKALTLNQSFGGTGKLILKGGGSVTFAAGCTLAGGLEVRGGTKVVFNDTLAPAGLTVGKDGTECVLSLKCGRTLQVNGDLDVGRFKITITDGTYEKSPDFRTIFRVTGDLVGETAAKWDDVVFTSGISSEGALDVSVAQDEDATLLGFKVRDPITVTVAVPAGEDVVTNKVIKTCAGDTLVFDVGADGSFTSEYPVRTGAILVKRGEGTLVLGNENNSFLSVTNEAGTIVLKHPNALGGMPVPVSGEGIVYDFAEPGETASTFTVAKAQSNEAIRVEIANADVTMPLYDILNGGIVKDGPGAAAFLMPNKDVRLSFVKETPWKGNKQDDAGFVIRQGEVAFRGRTPTMHELVYAYMGLQIGVDDPIESARVSPPQIVFDHIRFDAAAAYFKFAQSETGPSAGEASVIVTNGAFAKFNKIIIGRNYATPTSVRSHITVDGGSTLQTINGLLAYPDGGCLYLEADNASRVELGGTSLRGSFDFTFRNGSALSNANGGRLNLGYGVASHETKLRFESGSVMNVGTIGEDQADKTSLSSVCRLTFDDGEWQPCIDEFTFGFTRITGELAVKGAGLVLAPTNTQVWTVGTPIVDSTEGAGGLVKRGEGTVVLNAANLKYTGVTRLEGGVLDLDGTEVEDLKIESVGGAFAHGTLVKPTYRVAVDDDWQAATPAVIDPSLVSGRVTIDLGRTEANPLPLPYRSLAVATYTGDVAPDVSKWKATGTGIPNTKVTLSVDPSTKTVTATADQRDGFIIFLQ